MAKKLWTIKGIIKVKENMTTGAYIERPLQNVEVKVSGASVGRIFASWGKTRTKSDGSFIFKTEKSSGKRDVKVSIQFDDNELVVTKPITNSDWYLLYDKRDISSGIIDIGTKTFAKSKSGVLGGEENYRVAAAWYVCKKIISELKSHDPWFAYKKSIKVVYPAKVISNVPYANGVTRTAYIDPNPKYIPDDTNFLHTLVHEIMHLWNYDHNKGTSNWLKAICDGNTHSFQEDPAIAFHEGFAEYAKDDLLHKIWKWEKVEPFDRKYLNSNLGLRNLTLVEGSDKGVTNALHVLTTPNIYRRYFGTNNSTTPEGNYAGTVSAIKSSGCPSSPNIDIWQVLKVFRASPSKGWDTDWQVGNKSYGIVRFFERASDILSGLGKKNKDLFLELIDPSSIVEPQDSCTGPEKKIIQSSNTASRRVSIKR